MDGTRLNSLILSVNHSSYGTLFATMIKGSGDIISDEDDNGEVIPWLTTEQILAQLLKFGFIIQYDVKSNLSSPVLSFLSSMYNLGYTKINRIGVRMPNRNGQRYIRPTYILMKDVGPNSDILKFDETISKAEFNEKLDANIVMNITDEVGPNAWDWVTYMANLEDILEENLDERDDFKTKTDVKSGLRIRPHMIDNIDLTAQHYTRYDEDEDSVDDAEFDAGL